MAGRFTEELEGVDALCLGVGVHQYSEGGDHLAMGCVRGSTGVDAQSIGDGARTGQPLGGEPDRALDPPPDRGVDRVEEVAAAAGEPLDLANTAPRYPQAAPPAVQPGYPAPAGGAGLTTLPPSATPRDEFDLGIGCCPPPSARGAPGAFGFWFGSKASPRRRVPGAPGAGCS